MTSYDKIEAELTRTLWWWRRERELFTYHPRHCVTLPNRKALHRFINPFTGETVVREYDATGLWTSGAERAALAYETMRRVVDATKGLPPYPELTMMEQQFVNDALGKSDLETLWRSANVSRAASRPPYSYPIRLNLQSSNYQLRLACHQIVEELRGGKFAMEKSGLPTLVLEPTEKNAAPGFSDAFRLNTMANVGQLGRAIFKFIDEQRAKAGIRHRGRGRHNRTTHKATWRWIETWDLRQRSPKLTLDRSALSKAHRMGRDAYKRFMPAMKRMFNLPRDHGLSVAQIDRARRQYPTLSRFLSRE